MKGLTRGRRPARRQCVWGSIRRCRDTRENTQQRQGPLQVILFFDPAKGQLVRGRRTMSRGDTYGALCREPGAFALEVWRFGE